MPELQSPEAFLAACAVEPAVFELRPDYRATAAWRDDVAVTCRRWNWRQGRRTALSVTGSEVRVWRRLIGAP